MEALELGDGAERTLSNALECRDRECEVVGAFGEVDPRAHVGFGAGAAVLLQTLRTQSTQHLSVRGLCEHLEAQTLLHLFSRQAQVPVVGRGGSAVPRHLDHQRQHSPLLSSSFFFGWMNEMIKRW